MSNAQKQSLNWIDEKLEQVKSQDRYRSLTVRESPHVAGQVQIDGQQFLDFGSNDYLGLSSHPALVDIVKSNAGYVGWGSAASPLIHGRGTLHARLEQAIADFEQTESSLTFTSGFAANVGVITSLVGKGDAIFSDAKNHASIIDGCRLSGADVFVYRHVEVDHLAELLQASPADQKKLIVTDGLFSMDGDLAPLTDIVELAQTHNAMVMVDEAHATGVLGACGRGVAEHCGVKDAVDVTVGTLSKSLGCHGGFVAGSEKLIDWITNSARTYIFSTAVPEATCMAAVKALELVSEMGEARKRLLEKSSRLRESLQTIGLNVGSSTSQIIPLILGNESLTLKGYHWLKEAGLFVPAIRPPSVPAGESMLRISLNSEHTEEMIGRLLQGITEFNKA